MQKWRSFLHSRMQSLEERFFLLALVLTLGILAHWTLASLIVQSSLEESQQLLLEQEMRRFVSSIRPLEGGQLQPSEQQYFAVWDEISEAHPNPDLPQFYGVIRDETGRVIWPSNPPQEQPGVNPLILKQEDGAVVLDLPNVDGRQRWRISQRLQLQGQFHVFEVLTPVNRIKELIRHRRMQLLVATLPISLMTLGIAAFLLIRMARPLKRLEADLDNLAIAKTEGLSEIYPTEIARIVKALNRVLAFSRERTRQYQTTLENLAHSIKNSAQKIVLEAYGLPKSEESKRIVQMGMDLGELSKHYCNRAGSTVVSPLTEARPIGQVLAGSLESQMHAAKLEKKDLKWQIADDVRFAGSAQDVIILLANLIDNALKYGGGQVSVDVREQNGDLSMVVADNGPGIPESRWDLAFRRGVRLDEKGEGFGLGLDHVRQIVELYNGHIVRDPTHPSGWFAIRVTFPAASPV